jgi:hypothetical protein
MTPTVFMFALTKYTSPRKTNPECQIVWALPSGNLWGGLYARQFGNRSNLAGIKPAPQLTQLMSPLQGVV